MLRTISKLGPVFLLLLPLASAQQGRVSGEGGNWTQEISGSLGAAKNLRVKVEIGSVRVEGGSQQGINYEIRNHSYSGSEEHARHEFENYKISTYVRGDTAWIVAELEEGRPHKFSGDFEVHVPREISDVKIETEGGNVTASGISGRVGAESGGGSIRFDDIGGEINAETGGGTIDVGNASSDVRVETGGGSIRINSAKGKVSAQSGGGSVTLVSGAQEAELQTGGGSIQVEHCAGGVKASTGGGSIDLGDIGGRAELETGGGSIRLSSAKGPVHAETGGGSIELNGVPSARVETSAGSITVKLLPGGERNDSSLETSAGDITVYLAPNLNISVRASIDVANGHSIRSDFSEIKVTSEGGDYGPKTISAEGNLNGGGPELKLSTATGDICIRRGR